MQSLTLKQDLISRLRELNAKKSFLPHAEMQNVNFASLKTEIETNLNKLKSSSRVYEILSYILFAITGGIALMKILDLGSAPDLNKGALLIFLTITNALMTLGQKIKIARLEKQFLLIDILQKVDSEN